MSYNINYTLSYSGTDSNFDIALKFLHEPEEVICQLAGIRYLFWGEGVRQEEMDGAMLRASLEYPTLLFKVRAEGEIAGDISEHYYHNGMMASYKAMIVIPEFSYKDLK